MGGPSAMLNALQIAASGVALNHANVPKARVWCPLMVLLSEGSSRGVDAAVLDPELQMLTDAARDQWPELYGRTTGLQLALDGQTLPTALVGWEMPELAKAFQSSDWRDIDLGAAFEAARAKMRNEPFMAGPAKDAYTNRASIENAIEVAEPLLMLRGFGGNGKGTLPYILDEVCTSWKLYGGKGAQPKTLAKLAEEGRAYVIATLEHFGRVRNSVIATKNPRAPDHARKTTPAAEQRWALHVAKLQGSLDLAGYADYFGGGGSGGGAGGRSEGDDGSGGGGSRDSGGGAKKQKKRAAAEDANADTRGVQMALDLRRKTLTVTPKGRPPIVYLTTTMRERAKAKQRCCYKGMAASALGLPEQAFCDFNHEEGCAEHLWAATGANLSLCRRDRDDAAERPPKKQKLRHGRGSRDGDDDDAGEDGDDDHGGGGGGGDGGGDDAGDDAGGADGDAGAGAGQPPSTAGTGGSGRAGSGGASNGSRGGGRGKGSGRGGKGGGRGCGKGGRKTIAFSDATAKAASTTNAANGSALASADATGATLDPSTDAGRDMLPGFAEKAGVVRIQKPIFVQALTRLATPIDTITIGDASGRVRDASNAAGWPAISVSEQRCTSTAAGFSFEGDVRDILSLGPWRRAIALPDAKQQAARMGLGMAAVKAADGRLFAGMARWLCLWCVAATAVCIVQPDVFIVDFYDAPVITTSPRAWGDDDDDLALLFWRGAPKPVPPTEGRVAASPTDGQRCVRNDAAASHDGLTRGVAAQLLPDDSSTDLTFGVEIERLAASFYAAGLPVPQWYNSAAAGPSEASESAYMLERGLGDGRRLDGRVVPRLVRRDLGDPTWCEGVDGRIAKTLRSASIPAVSPRGRAIADGYRALRRVDDERARRAQARQGRAHDTGITVVRVDAPGTNAVAVIPGRIDSGVVMLLLPGPSQSMAEVAGRPLPEAHGATSEARKLITSAAAALGDALFKANTHGDNTQAASARSALAMIIALGRCRHACPTRCATELGGDHRGLLVAAGRGSCRPPAPHGGLRGRTIHSALGLGSG
jgi:hypothetical protein